MKKTHFLLLFVLFSLACAEAQVKYKIQWLEAKSAWQVSLVPQENWAAPNNLTASGQVSLRAATGSLQVANVKNLLSGVIWAFNSAQAAPAESPGYDYFSFGLATLGTKGIQYQKDVEVPLFTFQNGLGCNGGTEVAFVENGSDPFMSPNSAKINIGNQITVFGAGGEAFAGFVGEGKATCTESVSPANEAGEEATSFEVFPTTVSTTVTLKAVWAQAGRKASVRIFDISGKLAFEQKFDFIKGENLLPISAEGFEPGAYTVEVFYDDTRQAAGRFVKQ